MRELTEVGVGRKVGCRYGNGCGCGCGCGYGNEVGCLV